MLLLAVVGGEELEEGGCGSRPPEKAGLLEEMLLVAEGAAERMQAAMLAAELALAAILDCWSCPWPCVAEL